MDKKWKDLSELDKKIFMGQANDFYLRAKKTKSIYLVFNYRLKQLLVSSMLDFIEPYYFIGSWWLNKITMFVLSDPKKDVTSWSCLKLIYS